MVQSPDTPHRASNLSEFPGWCSERAWHSSYETAVTLNCSFPEELAGWAVRSHGSSHRLDAADAERLTLGAAPGCDACGARCTVRLIG